MRKLGCLCAKEVSPHFCRCHIFLPGTASATSEHDLDLEKHEFIVPQKEVKTPADITEKWEKSEVRNNSIKNINIHKYYWWERIKIHQEFDISKIKLFTVASLHIGFIFVGLQRLSRISTGDE